MTATWRPPADKPASIDVQIAEVERVLAVHESFYRGAVARGTTNEATADAQWIALKGALKTLHFVKKNEATIRDAIKAATDKTALDEVHTPKDGQ